MALLDSLRRRFWGKAHELHGGTTGTEDPNIVGDAGPFDVAPGKDPGEETEVERAFGVPGLEVTDDVLPPEEPDAEERNLVAPSSPPPPVEDEVEAPPTMSPPPPAPEGDPKA